VTLGEILEVVERKPQDRWLVIILLVGILGLALSYFLFAPYFAILAPSGYSVVDQQTVFTHAANETVLAAWKAIEGGIEASLMSAYIDLFPFMPAYAALGFAWGLLLARRSPARTRKIGAFCSLCIFPAWLADIVETGIQAAMSLNVDSYPAVLVPVMSTAAVIKIAFFYATVLWCLVGSIVVLVRRLSGRT
jgi:hypothetical protein